MNAAVLVVDDSLTCRELVVSVLRTAGYDAVGAKDDRDAFKLIEERQFDLVITDFHMPGTDGPALIKALRTRPGYETVPVCILSCESSSALIEKGRAVGAAGWMMKPPNPQALIKTIGKLLQPPTPTP